MNRTKGIAPPLPAGVRWGYGAGGYSVSIFFLNFVFYGMYFFTDIVGIGPAAAGAIISIGALWDAVTNPIIGYLSDNRDPKKGRRRPFLLWAALPLAGFTFLSFFNPGFSPAGSAFYFAVVVMGCYTFQTMADVPYTSLAAEMTPCYDGRARLNACRNIFWNLGMFLSCAFLMMAEFFAAQNGGDMNAGFAWTSFVCALPVVPCLLVTYFATSGYERVGTRVEKARLNLPRRLLTPLKNKPFRYVTLMFALSIAAQTVNNAAGLYFYLNNLGWSEVMASTVFILSAAVGFFDTWLASVMVRKLSKRTAWNICMGAWGFSCLVLALFVLSPGASLWLVGLFVLANGLGLNTQYQLALGMVPDCIEVEEFKNGERREGMYYGLASFVQKVGAALAMAVCGLVLNSLGYDGMAPAQTADTLFGLRVMFGAGTGIFLLLSIAANLLNPMTRQTHNAIVEAIENKKAGKPYDTEGFQTLL